MRPKIGMLAGVIGALLLAAPARTEPADDIAAPILKVHNRERTALRIQPLEWDSILAAHAKTWAQHLVKLGKLEHSTNKDRPGEGENLWMGTTIRQPKWPTHGRARRATSAMAHSRT